MPVLLAKSTFGDGLLVHTVEGGQPCAKQRPRPICVSNFCLLGDFKSVVDLDTQVPHSRFQLGVPEKQLHRS